MAAPEQINSTITTGGTAQTARPADPLRESVTIQALDEGMWVNFLTTAAVNTGIYIAPGQSLFMRKADWPMVGNAISIISATTGSRYAITADVN